MAENNAGAEIHMENLKKWGREQRDGVRDFKRFASDMVFTASREGALVTAALAAGFLSTDAKVCSWPDRVCFSCLLLSTALCPLVHFVFGERGFVRAHSYDRALERCVQTGMYVDPYPKRTLRDGILGWWDERDKPSTTIGFLQLGTGLVGLGWLLFVVLSGRV